MTAALTVAVPILLGTVLAAPAMAQESEGPILPAVDAGTVGLNLNL